MIIILCFFSRVIRYIQFVDMDFFGNFVLIVKKQIFYRINLIFVVRFIFQVDIFEFIGFGVKILIVIVIDVDSGINFILIYNFIVNFIGGFYIDFNIGKYVI